MISNTIVFDNYPNLFRGNVAKLSDTFPTGWRTIVTDLFSRLDQILIGQDEWFSALELQIGDGGRLRVVWKLNPWIPLQKRPTQSDLACVRIITAELILIDDIVAHEINCAEFASWSTCRDCGSAKEIRYGSKAEQALCDACRVANGFPKENVVERLSSKSQAAIDRMCESQQQMRTSILERRRISAAALAELELGVAGSVADELLTRDAPQD